MFYTTWLCVVSTNCRYSSGVKHLVRWDTTIVVPKRDGTSVDRTIVVQPLYAPFGNHNRGIHSALNVSRLMNICNACNEWTRHKASALEIWAALMNFLHNELSGSVSGPKRPLDKYLLA